MLTWKRAPVLLLSACVAMWKCDVRMDVCTGTSACAVCGVGAVDAFRVVVCMGIARMVCCVCRVPYAEPCLVV